jgi:hypothetical protein
MQNRRSLEVAYVGCLDILQNMSSLWVVSRHGFWLSVHVKKIQKFRKK